MKKNEKFCLITTDVEKTSLLLNKQSDSVIPHLLNEGMPLLLNLYRKYQVKSTFFFTADLAEQCPELVKMVISEGHEVGCHGYSHDPNQSFGTMNFSEQLSNLKKSKSILENISGQAVISFRAPSLRVNKHTARALKETGFLIDSSVASQRFDWFLSRGSCGKLNWLFAPRKPYFVHANSLTKKGDTHILEVPVSAFIFPYIGTTLRIFPFFSLIIRKLLATETKYCSKPINFLTHPNEFIHESSSSDITNPDSENHNSFSIRAPLKRKNLGKPAERLLERELIFFSKHRFRFVTMETFYNIFKSFP